MSIAAAAIVLTQASLGHAEEEAAASAAPPPEVGRRRGIGVTPSFAHSFTPHSLSHEGLGLSAEVIFGKLMGVGAIGTLYGPFRQSSPNTPWAFPMNETSGSVLAEARFRVVNIERFDLVVGTGCGGVFTRPVALIDPRRSFDYKMNIAFSSGVIGRIYFTRNVALALELRDVIYSEQLENQTISTTRATDSSTWAGDKEFTHMFEARVGLSLFAWGS